MPIVNGLTVTLGDLVEETTQSTGTGSYSLDGAPSGRRTFAQGIGNGTRTIYKCETASGLPYEVGIGTVTSGAPSTISRDAILLSSNNNLPVSWSAGSKRIFCDISAALANQIWSRPGGSLPIGAVEQRGPFTFSGSQTVMDITGIASTAQVIHLGWSSIRRTASNSELVLQLGDSGGFENTGYAAVVFGVNNHGAVGALAPSAFFGLGIPGGIPPNEHFGAFTLIKVNTTFWTLQGNNSVHSTDEVAGHSFSGAKALTAPLDRLRFTNATNAVFVAQGTITCQIIHGV